MNFKSPTAPNTKIQILGQPPGGGGHLEITRLELPNSSNIFFPLNSWSGLSEAGACPVQSASPRVLQRDMHKRCAETHPSKMVWSAIVRVAVHELTSGDDDISGVSRCQRPASARSPWPPRSFRRRTRVIRQLFVKRHLKLLSKSSFRTVSLPLGLFWTMPPKLDPPSSHVYQHVDVTFSLHFLV